MTQEHSHDPLNPHSHDPNPQPPSANPTILLFNDSGEKQLTIDYLRSLPQTTLADCYIISTGHGTSGPFTFSGPTLSALMRATLGSQLETIANVEVVSGDGFGTRVSLAELIDPTDTMLLACELDGKPLTRAEGLVRLIVPSESDDALRQVKWIGEIRVILF